MTYFLIAFSAVAAVAVVIVAVSLFRKPGREEPSASQRIGDAGENTVNEILGESDSEKTVLRDFILDGNRCTHEIDHILVNSSGIFIIETKNWAGKISGTARGGDWVQRLNGHTVNRHPNPVKQNRKHADVIRMILPEKPRIIPITVFVQNNAPRPRPDGVVNLRDLESTISSYPEMYSRRAVKKFSDTIESNRSETTRESHIENVNRMIRS